MGKFQVANIKFSFDYCFNDYFKDNIEIYKIDDLEITNHRIYVNQTNDIKPVPGKVIGKKNPFTIINENEKIIHYTKKGKIAVLIKHDFDYKEISITLNSLLLNDLATTEYIMSSIIFLELAMHNGYLPLHASAVSYEGNALLFSAPSGTGKSTHVRYWKEVFNEVKIINDDKPIIGLENDELFVYGSPFSGEHKINQNIKARLKAIILLNQGTNREITKSTYPDTVKELMQNTLSPRNEKAWDKILPLIGKINNEIPILRYNVDNNINSVHTIYNYLKGNNII